MAASTVNGGADDLRPARPGGGGDGARELDALGATSVQLPVACDQILPSHVAPPRRASSAGSAGPRCIRGRRDQRSKRNQSLETKSSVLRIQAEINGPSNTTRTGALAAASASAKPSVPPENAGFSQAPSAPDHGTVLARPSSCFRRSSDCARGRGPGRPVAGRSRPSTGQARAGRLAHQYVRR